MHRCRHRVQGRNGRRQARMAARTPTPSGDLEGRRVHCRIVDGRRCGCPRFGCLVARSASTSHPIHSRWVHNWPGGFHRPLSPHDCVVARKVSRKRSGATRAERVSPPPAMRPGCHIPGARRAYPRTFQVRTTPQVGIHGCTARSQVPTGIPLLPCLLPLAEVATGNEGKAGRKATTITRLHVK